jgi:hypothetical protein
MTKPKDEALSPSDDATLARNFQKQAAASSPREGDTATLQGPAAPETEKRFSPGDVVGKRFRIVSFLAHGGMGEVYEAEDLAKHAYEHSGDLELEQRLQIEARYPATSEAPRSARRRLESTPLCGARFPTSSTTVSFS